MINIENDFEIDFAYIEYDMDVPRKKSRADVFTVCEAIRSGKSSKAHKMAPREIKRDRTKTKEAKKVSKIRFMRD